MTNGIRTKTISEAPGRAALVARALGFPRGWIPNEAHGETLNYVTTWSQHELNAIYVRAGGRVSTRLVTRTTSDGTTSPATEITLTVPVPNIGDVQIVTDWHEPDGGRDLPIMRAVPAAELIA
ncbi:hypothetical protein AB0J38_25920 [Streptomyces sp. NPDC050095]|uniref:hypothetical protein n=1 Tax=unclassified Streptomyces TaxID=2593676 RepID=UPI00343CA00C